MNPIHTAAQEIQDFCEENVWKFCFIGGLAVQRWGEPRHTQDADMTLLTGFGGEELWVDALLERFEPRRPDAREFSLRYRVLLISASNGVPLDVALGAMPFEERAIERSSCWRVSDQQAIRTCSAEDLVVHKAFAGRERDWADIEGILSSQKSTLKARSIIVELEPLLELKEDLQTIIKIRSLFHKYGIHK